MPLKDVGEQLWCQSRYLGLKRTHVDSVQDGRNIALTISYEVQSLLIR